MFKFWWTCPNTVGFGVWYLRSDKMSMYLAHYNKNIEWSLGKRNDYAESRFAVYQCFTVYGNIIIRYSTMTQRIACHYTLKTTVIIWTWCLTWGLLIKTEVLQTRTVRKKWSLHYEGKITKVNYEGKLWR